MRAALPCLLLLAVPGSNLPAAAGSSDWFETEGARIRLVTIDEPTQEGTLKGTLEIALDAGWKTYWADPGDAGIPPQIDVAGSLNVTGVEIAFPAPQRFEDTYGSWAGYHVPVALPVTFTVGDPDRFSAIDATVTLGVCSEVCVPVQAKLSVNARSADEEAEARADVEAAFANLPAPASENFGVISANDKDDTLEMRARVPAGASKAELFLVAPPGLKLGKPSMTGAGLERTFTFPVVRRNGGKLAELPYTLVSDGKAVSGVAKLN